MGSMSIWHWLVVAAVFMLFFGRGKISELMGDVASGIKAFKKGMAEDEDAVKKAEEEKARLEAAAASATDATKTAASSTKPN
jgi:sec-independent protein translocase protein TatA